MGVDDIGPGRPAMEAMRPKDHNYQEFALDKGPMDIHERLHREDGEVDGSARLGCVGGSAKLDCVEGGTRAGCSGGSVRPSCVGGDTRLGRRVLGPEATSC